LHREREIVIYQALGYGKGALYLMILIEVMIVALLAIVVSIPVSTIIARAINQKVSATMMVPVALYVTAMDVVKPRLLACALFVLTPLPVLVYLFRKSLAEGLRYRIFG